MIFGRHRHKEENITLSYRNCIIIHLFLIYLRKFAGAQTIAWRRIIGRTTCQPDMTTFLQPRHIPTQGYNITQSSAPDDGHMVARNML